MIIGLLIVGGGVVQVILDSGSLVKQVQPSPVEMAKQKADERRSVNAPIAVAIVRKHLRDPESLALESVLTQDGNLYCVEYRARNGFGGMNSSFAVVRVNLLSVSSDTTTWNKLCSRKSLFDETYAAGWNRALADQAVKSN